MATAAAPSMRSAKLMPATTCLRFEMASAAADSAWGAAGAPSRGDWEKLFKESVDASSEGEAAANFRFTNCGFAI